MLFIHAHDKKSDPCYKLDQTSIAVNGSAAYSNKNRSPTFPNHILYQPSTEQGWKIVKQTWGLLSQTRLVSQVRCHDSCGDTSGTSQSMDAQCDPWRERPGTGWYSMVLGLWVKSSLLGKVILLCCAHAAPCGFALWNAWSHDVTLDDLFSWCAQSFSSYLWHAPLEVLPC